MSQARSAPADGEIVSAARVRLAELADPAHRLIRHPSGAAGPAFRVHGMFVWGFTALLVDRLVALGGWEQPWDTGRQEDLPRTCWTPPRAASRSAEAPPGVAGGPCAGT